MPYEALIGNTLFEDELLKSLRRRSGPLLSGGLKVIDIPGRGVLRTQDVLRNAPGLSVNDALAFVLAVSRQGATFSPATACSARWLRVTASRSTCYGSAMIAAARANPKPRDFIALPLSLAPS